MGPPSLRMHAAPRVPVALEVDALHGVAPKKGNVAALLQQFTATTPRSGKRSSKTGTPRSKHAANYTADDYWSMKIEHLQCVAVARGIKKSGESWQACCGPLGNRVNIIAALRRYDKARIHTTPGDRSPRTQPLNADYSSPRTQPLTDRVLTDRVRPSRELGQPPAYNGSPVYGESLLADLQRQWKAGLAASPSTPVRQLSF